MKKNLITIAVYFLPTAVLSSVGILIIVFQRAGLDIVFGILVLILAVVILTGGIILQGILRAQTRRVRLQTDFVAKVSHELRTPLASIRMFVDTLQGGVQDASEQQMCLDVISSETSRLSSMIERLLSWGRMEAGRRSYRPRPELATTLVGEALAQLEPQLRSSGAELDLDLPDESEGSPVVSADRQAVVEALLNLMSNAIKYGVESPGDQVRVAVSTAGRRVLFEVADDGPGIPRREQRRIFEKFYRGTSEAVAQRHGSGLGLAMARLIAKAHRGRIRLASYPGQGASFILDLPVLSVDRLPKEVPPG